MLGIKQIPDECRKDTEEMLASHVPIAAVNEMIKIRTNNHVTGDSLKHLRRVVMAAKTGGTIDSNRSPAQLALDILRESKGCNYSYLSASMDRATSLVSIRKGSWKKGKKSTSLVDAASEEEQEPYEAYIDDERKRYVQSVLKSLSLGESFMLCLHLFLHIHISTHLVCIYCSLPIRICARAHVHVRMYAFYHPKARMKCFLLWHLRLKKDITTTENFQECWGWIVLMVQTMRSADWPR